MALDDEQQPPTAESDTTQRTEPSLGGRSLRIRCANCGELLADTTLVIVMDGTSTPVFVNPAGTFFELLLVCDVSNVFALGPATIEATWYRGYAWRYGICRLCVRHLGWHWEATSGDRLPSGFWGLIRDRIVVDSKDDESEP